MALLIKMFYESLKKFDEEEKDLRCQNYMLMRSPWLLIALTVLYYAFVKKIGPTLMQNRPAFDLKNVLLIYNMLQVIGNLAIAYFTTKIIFFSDNIQHLDCIPADKSSTPLANRTFILAYLYFVLKVIDYMDTVFFVLRKRYKQVTFLHVYHHITMVFGSYYGARYVGGGHIIVLGYVNLFVHAIMYFYYFISALRTDVRHSIGWKKYITQLQIFQFIILIAHFIRPLLSSDCQQSMPLMAFCALQNMFMLVMFSDFYIRTYIRKPKTKTTQIKQS